MYDHPERFRLDKPLDSESTEELVRLATDFLQQKDSPSLETVCMQVAFDSVYFRNHTELEAAISAKRAKLQEIEADVCSASAASASDFNAMTQVYHQIFQYLTCHAEVDSSDGDDEVLREIAAALESVFPRVGLKAFVSLSQSEKSSQLKELARLILGTCGLVDGCALPPRPRSPLPPRVCSACHQACVCSTKSPVRVEPG